MFNPALTMKPSCLRKPFCMSTTISAFVSAAKFHLLSVTWISLLRYIVVQLPSLRMIAL